MPHSHAHFDFETLLANLPGTENDFVSAIDVLEERNERELALQMLELAVKRCPSGELRRMLAERYLLRRNLVRAQELLVEQTLEDPDDGQGLLLLARAYGGLGQIERARESLQRAHASGIAQDRVLYWANKLNIPAERKPQPAKPLFSASFDNAGADDPTSITYLPALDSRPDSHLDPLSELRRSAELNFESLEPNDETGIHFGLLADENSAEPNDETGIHFGLLPGELDFEETAGPTDETGIHFGLLPDEDATDNQLRESGSHEAIRQSQQLAAAPFQRPTNQAQGYQLPAELRISAAHEAIDFSQFSNEDEPQSESPQDGYKPASLRTSQSMAAVAMATPPPTKGFHGQPATPPPSAPVTNHLSSDASLELDHRPYVDARAQAATPTPLSSSNKPAPRALRNLTQIRIGKPRFSTIRALIITLIVLIVLCLAAVAFISKNEITRLEKLQTQALAAAANDTYTDYLKAHALLQQAALPSVYMGGLISSKMFTKLTLPGLNPDDVRPAMDQQFALISALLEYRFESAGSRDAAEAVQNATGSRAAANIYLALTAGQRQNAQAIIDGAPKDYSDNAPLRAAVGHALLDAIPPTPEPALRAFIDTLTALPNPTVHDRFLLAMMHLRREDQKAATEQLEALETTHPNHTSARLELAKIHSKTDTARAQSILRSITEAPKEKFVSPFEKAQAYIALGQTFADDPGKTEDNFKLAVATMPRRVSIYKPLLDLYLKNLQFDDARTLLTQAHAANETSEYIARMRAELFLSAGMASQSLQLLDARMSTDFPPLEKPASFHWLRGLSYLQLNDPANAMQAFQLAAKDNSSRVSSNASTAAAAFALYAGALSDDSNLSAAEAAILKLSQNIREENHDAADIHRAAGLIQLLNAHHNPSSPRATNLARAARKSFEHALTLRENDSVLLFDICQTDVFLRTRPNKSCDAARAINPEYLPGMLTVAQLHIQDAKFEQARDLLLKLRSQHPLHPTIAILLGRVFVELKEIDKASIELNSLLGKPEQKSLEWDILEGRIALSKSEYTRALGYFERAYNNSAKSPEQNTELTLYLSQTLTILGLTERAAQIMPQASPPKPKRKAPRRR